MFGLSAGICVRHRPSLCRVRCRCLRVLYRSSQHGILLPGVLRMSARAIWKGTLKLGSEKLAVKLYSAVEDRTVHFHVLDKSTMSRVKQRMVNPETGDEVTREQMRKG